MVAVKVPAMGTPEDESFTTNKPTNQASMYTQQNLDRITYRSSTNVLTHPTLTHSNKQQWVQETPFRLITCPLCYIYSVLELFKSSCALSSTAMETTTEDA